MARMIAVLPYQTGRLLLMKENPEQYNECIKFARVNGQCDVYSFQPTLEHAYLMCQDGSKLVFHADHPKYGKCAILHGYDCEGRDVHAILNRWDEEYATRSKVVDVVFY